MEYIDNVPFPVALDLMRFWSGRGLGELTKGDKIAMETGKTVPFQQIPKVVQDFIRKHQVKDAS